MAFTSDFDLSNYKNIHLIGIGGIGLSALAYILLDKGFNVSGSDILESDIIEDLIEKGAKCYLGHRDKYVKGKDLVVYTVAANSKNPELVYAKNNNIKCLTRAELLGYLMDKEEKSIAITGTHGKTTTTGMISTIFKTNSQDPTILIGGFLDDINGNYNIGSESVLITEACEYMDSFLQLRPTDGVILNIESDHLDYFSNIEQIKDSFEIFANNIKENGTLYVFDSNPFILDITKKVNKNVVTFGFSKLSTVYASNITFSKKGTPSFDLYIKEKFVSKITLSVPGEHNITNALASIAVANNYGIDIKSIKKALKKYTGIKRRFDELGKTLNGVRVIDDYAHHPTEIKATLNALKYMKYKKLYLIFQPHTFTRTFSLYKDFAESLAKVDNLILAKIYPAREKNINNITSKIIMDEMKNDSILYMEDFDEIAEYLYKNAGKGDIVLTLGAGDIYKVGEILLGYDLKDQEQKHERLKLKGVRIDD